MRYIDIHSHNPRADGLEQATLGRQRPEGKYSLGIHPWMAAGFDKGWLEELRTDKNMAAVGEIGLDYARDVPHGLQQRLFEEQLTIAAERGLPVILHCVKAFEPLIDTLARYELPAAIFHSFVGSREQARRVVERGYYLSLGAHSFLSSRVREALVEMPLAQLFVETDDQPVPIEKLYAEAASIKGIAVEELAAATERNFKRIFP